MCDDLGLCVYLSGVPVLFLLWLYIARDVPHKERDYANALAASLFSWLGVYLVLANLGDIEKSKKRQG